MQTASKFNGPKRDKSKQAFGYFSEQEVDRLVKEQRLQSDPKKRRELVQAARAGAESQPDYIGQGCVWILVSPGGCPRAPQTRQLPESQPHSGPCGSRPDDVVLIKKK